MTIINPSEVRQLREKRIKEELEILRDKVNTKLADSTTDRILIDASGFSKIAWEALTNEARKAGWIVKYTSDQRDGDWYEFSS